MDTNELSRKVLPPDLQSWPGLVQNYKDVISGRGRASFRSMAGPGPLPRSRPRDLLPREGWVVPGGQADLRRLPRPHRVPELRPSPRRAVWGVGRDERTGAPALEAHGFLIPYGRR